MIAVVIPYFKKIYFRKTLESLANQTDKRFKVYIGDDASPEDPRDLIEEYQDKVNLKYQRFDSNVGGHSLVQQWKRCIELTEDEVWLMILGDDDYFEPNVIESFYRKADEFKDQTSLVRFARRTIYSDDTRVSEIQKNPKWETPADSFYRRITGEATSTLSEYAFTRIVYNKFGFYDYPLAWHSDNRAWIEFPGNDPMFSINDAIVNIIRSPQSISGSHLNADQKRKANLSFYNYLITEKLPIFSRIQAIRILHKLENEVGYQEKITFKFYLSLLPYYLKNYYPQKFRNYFVKMIKSILVPK